MSEKKGEPSFPSYVLHVPEFNEDRTKYVQLTPMIPADGSHTVVVQGSRYGGQWVRMRNHVPAKDLDACLTTCEDVKSGAVYVGIPQRLVSTEYVRLRHTIPESDGLLRYFTRCPSYSQGATSSTIILKQQTNWCVTFLFDIHTEFMLMIGLTPTQMHQIWYKWTRKDVESRVPKYATSIEGGGAIVLSPDEKEFLLVFEYGRWGRAGGALDLGESCIETAIREVDEETGVELDDSFVPLLGLGYQQPCSRDGLINDHFLYFLVKAKTKTIKLDETELQGGKWFDVKESVEAFRKFRVAWKADKPSEPLPSRMELSKEWVGTMELMAVERFLEKRAHPVTFMKNPKRQKPSIVF
uniref:Nudix hydrolase domain-containing protein n=1 Tax=Lotharella globosa TaxID=91324 RepID=A0A7S3Z5A1_9EUKA